MESLKLNRYNVDGILERTAFGFLGHLPWSSSSNKCILVFMDYFTKWPEECLVPDQETSSVAEMLLQQWVSRFGTVVQIHFLTELNLPTLYLNRSGPASRIRDAAIPPLTVHRLDFKFLSVLFTTFKADLKLNTAAAMHQFSILFDI